MRRIGEDFFFPGNSTGVLLIHGFTASPTEMVGLGTALNHNGVTTHGVLLQGHGTEPKDLAHTRWQDWYESARKGFVRLQNNCDSVVVVGLSAGALLAAMLAGEHKEIKALCMLAPAIRLRSRLLFCTKWISPFVPTLPKSQRQQEFYNRYGLFSYPVIPTRALTELRRLITATEGVFEKITIPTQIIVGGQDDRIHPQSAEIAFRTIPAYKKTLLHLPKGGHVITVGLYAEQLSAAVNQFVDRHASSSTM